MLKHLANIDEIAEQHKGTTPMFSKEFEVKTKKEIREKEKLINPKQIFEKTPKNTKGRSAYRSSNVDSNKPIPAIKESGY